MSETNPIQIDDDDDVMPNITGNSFKQNNNEHKEIEAVNSVLREQHPKRRPRQTYQPTASSRPDPNFESSKAMAIELQKMLVPGAEDISIIDQMMTLKDETVNYLTLAIQHRQNVVRYPIFYETTVYYLFKMAQARNQRVVYLHHLADVVENRIRENVPQLAYIQRCPSLKEIFEKYQAFEPEMGIEFEKKREQAWVLFEKILGEAFFYIQFHYNRHGAPPLNLQFLLKFFILFHKFNKKKNSTEKFETTAFERLSRNLEHINPKYFEHLHKSLRDALKIPFLRISFA